MRTVKKTKKHTFTYNHYFICIVIFLCVLMTSITVFSSAVRRSVDVNTRETIMRNVQRQKEHFQIFLNEQFSHMEGIADHVGKQDDLMAEDNFILITDFVGRSAFHRITIWRPDGTGVTNEGTEITVTQTKHFQDALEGRRGLSDPLESYVDGQTLVALSVPIFEPETDTVKGVLTASYNIELISRLMFEDLYKGRGIASIVGGDGEVLVVASDESEKHKGRNIFDYYSAVDFYSGSFEQMQEDFTIGGTACLRAGRDSEERYIAYMPMEMEDWMLCYAVPLSAARENFVFMTFYTRILACVLSVTVVVLVFSTWIINRRRERSLVKKAETDALTDVLNRESFEQKVNEWLTADVYNEFQAFLMLDLDNFKSINDTYGHSAGDEVLRQTASLLKNTFRGSDLVGRIGGDEFVVLMKNVRLESVVNFYMQEVCNHLSSLEIPELQGTRLHCSIGAACAPNHGNTFAELYNRADSALYEVKRHGRNDGKLYSNDNENK